MNGFPVTSFNVFLTDILDALLQNLEKRSLLYGSRLKQPLLGTVFLLNNYHYMHKHVAREVRLGELFGSNEDRFEKLVHQQRLDYLNRFVSLFYSA